MPSQLPNVQPAEAIEYFRSRGYKIGFDWRDTRTRTHADAFTVAKAMELDILKDIRGALDQALTTGTTFKQFQKDLAPTLKRKGWWGTAEALDPLTGEFKKVQLGSSRRLRTIFDANLRSSYAAGHWAQIQRTKRRRPYLRYVAILDDRTRPEHKKWHGLIRPVDDPIWRTLYPPNGWHCRCLVQQLSERDLERNGWTVSPKQDLPTRPWHNERNGETLDIPIGIDPGWQENAGVNYQRHLEKRLSDKLERLAPEVQDSTLRKILNAPEFKQLLKARHGGSLPVGIVPSDIKKHLNAGTATVKISDQTAFKNLKRHPDITPGDYLLVQNILRHGEVIEENTNNLIFQANINGKRWRAVVKTTSDRRELYLTTLHRITATHRNRALRKGKLIKGEN